MMRRLLLFSFLLLFGTSCGTGISFFDKKRPTFTAHPPGVRPSPQILVVQNEACQFYKAQNLILDCHEEENLFSAGLEQRKNLIYTGCAGKAFSAVWGTGNNFTPAIPTAPTAGFSVYYWGFFGQPGAHFDHAVQSKYQKFLTHFKNSINPLNLNNCLGGNYPYSDVDQIINTALIGTAANLSFSDPEVFLECYRAELQTYGTKNGCLSSLPQVPSDP